MLIKNIFEIAGLPQGDTEIFETLGKGQNIEIEKIVSYGQTTPEGKWYDSVRNEWVVLLQGKATIELENSKLIHLTQGDYILIPAGQKHRIAFTSKDPHCIWLAVHFD